jgi:hypothetical protein|tara:strand:- start:1820 stop:2467 length:648 start_codon:yes stop_codon:yes gene_type:complete
MNNDYIVEYRNAFPHELCDELMSKWQPPKSNDMLDFHPTTPASILREVKTSRDLIINLQDPYLERLNLRYHETLQICKDKYAKIALEKNEDRIAWSGGQNLAESMIAKSSQTDVIISRTDAGEMYNWHTDAHRNRLLTCILYLNDMDEDAGGCTEFSNGRSVRPEKGKVLIFPATIHYIHRGTRVNKGSKYVIATFSVYNIGVRSLPFKINFDKD